MTDLEISAKLDRIIGMLENPEPYVPACWPGENHVFTEYERWRCMKCGADGRDLMAWSARQERA